MDVGILRFSFFGISAVRRRKVDKKITEQEHNEVFLVLFHLDPTLSLFDEQEKELETLEIEMKNLEVSMILCYCEHQEVGARGMAKIVKTKKKIFLQSMAEQGLLEKVINYKFDGTSIVTPSSRPKGTLMYTLITTTSSNSNGTPMCTPMTRVSSKSKDILLWTGMGTQVATPNFKVGAHQ